MTPTNRRMTTHVDVKSAQTLADLPEPARRQVMVGMLAAVDRWFQTQDATVLEEMAEEIRTTAWSHEHIPGYTDAVVSREAQTH